MKLPKSTLYRLARVARMVHALRNPEDGQCCIDPKVKEAVRLYVDHHVLPHLHSILHEEIHGRPVFPFKDLGRSVDEDACEVIRWIRGMPANTSMRLFLTLPPNGATRPADTESDEDA